MAVTLAAGPASSRRKRQVSWQSVGRVVLLEHRAAFLSISGLFIICALTLLFEGIGTTLTRAQFLHQGGANTNALNFLNVFVLAFAAIVGVFIGAPLIARELETGTFRFTWTQGVGRGRLTRITIVLLSVTFAVLACVLGALLTWYAHKFEVLGIESRWQAGFFLATPLVLPAWTLLSLSLGVLIGALVKKTVASMAVSAIGITGLLTASFAYFINEMLSMAALKTSRMSPIGLSLGRLDMSAPYGRWPTNGWLVRGWLTTARGRILTGPDAVHLMHQSVAGLKTGSGGQRGITFWVSYQPADRFWIIQLIGTAILLSLTTTILLIASKRIRSIG